MKRFKPFPAMFLSVMMIAGLAACSGGPSARVTKPALLQTVNRYEMDYSTGEWYLKETMEFEYENGYPVLIKTHDYDGDMDSQKTFKYSFNDEGLPAEMKGYNDEGELYMRAVYDEQGRVDMDYAYSGGESGQTQRVYQYGNRDEYFTMVHHETVTHYPDEPDTPPDHAEEIDSVIVTAENGLLRKTTNDGIYANWGGDTEKEWIRFMGSYTANYNDDGIVDNLDSLYSIGDPESKSKVDITVQDGAIAEAVYSDCHDIENEGDKSNWEATRKWEFVYNDTEISLPRYASMINSIIMEGGGTFYIYNWY